MSWRIRARRWWRALPLSQKAQLAAVAAVAILWTGVIWQFLHPPTVAQVIREAQHEMRQDDCTEHHVGCR